MTPDQAAVELTPAQGRALFYRRCMEELGMSGKAFLAAWDEACLISGDPEAIARVRMLLPFAGRQP